MVLLIIGGAIAASGQEAKKIYATRYAHERVPDKAAALVFRHQHGDSRPQRSTQDMPVQPWRNIAAVRGG
jgi:hypothetical protein